MIADFCGITKRIGAYMKIKLISWLIAFALLISSLVSCDISGASSTDACEGAHTDENNNGKCDSCKISVIAELDFFAINDLHGKFDDTDTQPGVDELSTYLKLQKITNPNTVFLSSGDMWQGSSESNLTHGNIMTEWMNELGFASMTLGNHEYDWGSEKVKINGELAEFPLLAINVFDRATNERVSYASPSVTVSLGDIEIGIIGAIGDVYSDISSDKVQDVYFKVGDELTELVMRESERLKSLGADIIVYSLHDGYEKSKYNGSVVPDSDISSYYDIDLSYGGYVDIVFEGHTHKSYSIKDTAGIYHLQGGGENRGICHAELQYNVANGTMRISEADYLENDVYSSYDDDALIDELLDRYADKIAKAYELLGTNPKYMDDSEFEAIVAELYYEFGLKTWGDKYDIALGGGFIRTRSPYNLDRGEVYYSDIYSLLPFDNELVLCSVKGYDLKRKFFESSNEDYYIAYGNYGASLLSSIDLNATYYIVTDMYTALYAYNNLTVIEVYGGSLFARDLFAEFVREGGLG